MSEQERIDAREKLGIEPLEDEGEEKQDHTAELKRLADQRNRDIITDEEFKAKKKQILGVSVSVAAFGPFVRQMAEAGRISYFFCFLFLFSQTRVRSLAS